MIAVSPELVSVTEPGIQIYSSCYSWNTSVRCVLVHDVSRPCSYVHVVIRGESIMCDP